MSSAIRQPLYIADTIKIGTLEKRGVLFSFLQISKPWMLAGGLNHGNVANAKAQTSARYFDVSSAVESQKGVKDHNLIQQFVDAVK